MSNFDPNEPVRRKEMEEEAEYLKNSAVSIYGFILRSQQMGLLAQYPKLYEELLAAQILITEAAKKIDWAIPFYC